jgi:leucyl/phenylalanyl-tRNA--protein transferase
MAQQHVVSRVLPWLPAAVVFPPPEEAFVEPNGLLAAGGDLSSQRLIAAYRQGIFPWYSDGEPILWWSPDPRMVLLPAALRIHRSLSKALRKARYVVRLDYDFPAVIHACAQTPRHGQSGTWIQTEMIAAYCELHRLGYAHSVETWIDGRLAGGLYGIAIGGVFYGESMFTWVTDASKIALAHLCAYLKQRKFGIIDCQMETGHLRSLGAQLMPRKAFVDVVARLSLGGDPPGRWRVDAIDGYYRGNV